MGGLAEDIMMEILVRLPVKSILRTRCFSKSWNRLISEDYLRRKRLPPAMAGIIYERQHTNEVMLLSTTDESRYNGQSPTVHLDFDSFPFCGNLKIVSVCNGLVLCSNLMMLGFSVCNPVTTSWKILNICDGLDPVAIGFDPRLSRHYRVLGRYKENSTYKFKMFLSESDSWVDCAGSYRVDDPTKNASMTYVFLDGIFHVRCAVYQSHERIEIFSVDCDEKNCRRIELPYHVPETWSQSRIGVSDGVLHLAMRSEDAMLVWGLEDYENDQWVLKHFGSFADVEEKLGIVNIYPSGGYTFMHFHPDTNVIYIHLEEEEVLVSYNFATGNLQVICNMMKRSQGYHPFSPCFSSNDV